MFAPISLERKAQGDRWGSVGIIPIKLVGVEWIDSSLPDLAGIPAKISGSVLLLVAVGEVEDAMLCQCV